MRDRHMGTVFGAILVLVLTALAWPVWPLPWDGLREPAILGRATVPLPTGVACSVTALARRSASSRCVGWKPRKWATAAAKSST